jgi:hypothetical protein
MKNFSKINLVYDALHDILYFFKIFEETRRI